MRKLAFILFLFPMLLHGAPDSQSLDEILCNLDAHIEKKEDYVQEKQRRIEALQDELKKGAPEREYDLNYGLFEEYQSFKYDSAYFYAGRALELAVKTGCPDRIAQSRCALVFCYLSSGRLARSLCKLLTDSRFYPHVLRKLKTKKFLTK